MKIHQHGAKIFNKKCSFEVSIGLLPHIVLILAPEHFFSITHTLIFCSVCNSFLLDHEEGLLPEVFCQTIVVVKLLSLKSVETLFFILG